MGKIKQQKSEEKKYTLSEREFNYLKILNIALQYNTLKDKLISGFLYYVCNNRFGYSKDVNLVFEVDLEDEKRQLSIKELPNDIIEQAVQNQPQNPPSHLPDSVK